MRRIIVKRWKSGRGYRYKLVCNHCGNEFEKTGASLSQDKCYFCSKRCSNTDKRKIEKDNKSKIERKKKLGYLFSVSAKERMSEGQKRRYDNPIEREKSSEKAKKWIKERGHPRGMLGKTAWNKGKKNPLWQGKNNPNWNNGSSFEEYGQEFNEKLKEGIRERDKRTCQLCNKTEKEELKDTGKRLDVHHKNYNKKDNRKKNLITLCHKCHLKTNHNRKYWLKVFKVKSIIRTNDIVRPPDIDKTGETEDKELL